MEGREGNFQGEFKLPGGLVGLSLSLTQSPVKSLLSGAEREREECRVATAQVDNGSEGGRLRSLSWPGEGSRIFVTKTFSCTWSFFFVKKLPSKVTLCFPASRVLF